MRKDLMRQDEAMGELLSAHGQDELETQVRLGEVALQEAQERLRMKTLRSPVRGRGREARIVSRGSTRENSRF